jgi:hypothetical protein
MSPNLFLCLRTVFCPLYWFHHGDRIQGSIAKTEHWESPVPGVYRYIPGHGWHLIARDGQGTEKLPVRLVYCRIVHRYLFEHELDDRCSWHCITPHDGAPNPEKLRFFLLDDGRTWVAGWDSRGEFIPGPYQKWRFDPVSNSMRKVESPPGSSNVSRRSSVVPNKWD